MELLNAKRLMACAACVAIMFGSVIAQDEATQEETILQEEAIIAQEQASIVEDEGEWLSEEDEDNDVDKLKADIQPYFTEGTKEFKERQKRLKKMDKWLGKMAKAGLIMGAYDVFGSGSGTIYGAAAAAAAYGFLNVTKKGVTEMEKAMATAGIWKDIVGTENPEGVTEINSRCDDRKSEIEVIRKTIAKQAALAAGVSAGVALAVKHATDTKALGDIKYGVLATGAVGLSIPELNLQRKVTKLARMTVESCTD